LGEDGKLNDMRRDFARILNNLQYTRQRNFIAVNQCIDSLPDYYIIEEENNEENNEVSNYVEDEEPFPVSIIERNPQVNKNFMPNENLAHQGGIYGLNTDPAMDVLINLVRKHRKK
jgi:hypothetical protein